MIADPTIRLVTTTLPDRFPVTPYYAKDCPLGCGTVIAGISEEQVRAGINAHRNLSGCVERRRRYAERLAAEGARVRREARAVEKEAAAAPPPPPKKVTRKSWRATKVTRNIGWDGKPIG